MTEGNTQLTGAPAIPTLKKMEVYLAPDLQAKLTRLATEQGRDSQALVQEAVERLVDYDNWFLREVERGLSAADRGEFIEHEDIGTMINSRYPG
jgi:predicted transcriptional regulator